MSDPRALLAADRFAAHAGITLDGLEDGVARAGVLVAEAREEAVLPPREPGA